MSDMSDMSDMSHMSHLSVVDGAFLDLESPKLPIHAGSLALFEPLAARLHSSLHDRRRPLWESHVIEGLADGRLGFCSKVHHAPVDDQAAVAMGNSIFDAKPAALANPLQQVVQLARLLLLPLLLLPPAEVKAIGKAHGASVSDSVLWLCSTALREYLRDSRELPDKTLLAGVPISLRAEGDTSSNDQVSGTVIVLATQLEDPLSIVVQGVASNITVQSCRVQLCFGLIACRRAAPDFAALAAQLQRALRAARALLPAEVSAAAPAPARESTPPVAVTAVKARRRKPPALKKVPTAKAAPAPVRRRGASPSGA